MPCDDRGEVVLKKWPKSVTSFIDGSLVKALSLDAISVSFCSRLCVRPIVNLMIVCLQVCD